MRENANTGASAGTITNKGMFYFRLPLSELSQCMPPLPTVKGERNRVLWSSVRPSVNTWANSHDAISLYLVERFQFKNLCACAFVICLIKYLLTYLLTYLLACLLTYLLTYLVQLFNM